MQYRRPFGNSMDVSRTCANHTLRESSVKSVMHLFLSVSTCNSWRAISEGTVLG